MNIRSNNAPKDNSPPPGKNQMLVRSRMNALLAQTEKKTLTIVCAGMGCGKTCAVYDYSQQCGMPVAWVQLTESDNISIHHYWKNSIHAIEQIDAPLAKEYRDLGFPDSEDKFNKFLSIRSRESPGVKYMLVFDDFHHIKNPALLNFFEKAFNNTPRNRSFILISREFPQINISRLLVKDDVFMITEDELNFTEAEIYHFLLQQGLGAETNSLSKIYKDTKGWTFIVNFVARMLEKTPGYSGYVQGAIKQGIDQLIESETWNVISKRLKRLFLRLSLTDHRSAELVGLLAKGDETLLSELKRQNAFIRIDRQIDVYYIHSLFLDFLYTKQDSLTGNEKRSTYKMIADWCVKNDFIVDALLNYEKIGDYESIVSILFQSSVRFLMDNTQVLLKIFDRMPDCVFDDVETSAAMHVHLVMNSGDLRETMNLLQRYEEKYLSLPDDNAFRNRMLGCLYYQWAILRMVLCTSTDGYDFETFFNKSKACLEKYPLKHTGSWYQHPPGMWTSLAGSRRAGALDEFTNAVHRSQQHAEETALGLGKGLGDLCKGEMHFYQARVSEAEQCIEAALEKAREHSQNEIVWRALHYILRIAIFQGDFSKAEKTLADMEIQLEKNADSARFLIYDVIIGGYYSTIGQPEQIPTWLKGKFSFAVFYCNTLENYGNHIKAKYCYMTKNYKDLLAYIDKKKHWEIVLLERVELLALEACAHFKMKNSDAAFTALYQAYYMAYPNDIKMPFIEMGKDMRTLMNAAAGDPDCKIPEAWLKNIKQKVSAFTQKQTHIISEYKKKNEPAGKILLSPREIEILQSLIDGLSRSEIAAKYGLSVNTIKVHINSIYEKLNAQNRADIYRIAIEQNLITR